MTQLSDIQAACKNVESAFEHRSILYIGSESYDAPTITLLRGLHGLGFTIYTIGKPNINSWTVNTVIDRPLPKTDFVLSNLHWGTRWSHYDKLGLHGTPKVLVDGADNHWGITWREKHQKYQQKYAGATQEQKDGLFATRRWIEPLGRYEPGIVFAGQNQPGHSTHYLPFGIMPEYAQMAGPVRRRDLFFLHVMGEGPYRRDAHRELTTHKWRSLEFLDSPAKHTIKGAPVESRAIRGKQVWPEWVPQQGRTERNIHSWHRWSMDAAYYRALARTNILVYPGVSRYQWESKRPWEAWACGCIVLMRKLPLDTSDYPLDELAPDPLLTFTNDLVWHCEMLVSLDGDRIAELRGSILHAAYTYFTPVPIARYALHQIVKSGILKGV